MKPTPFNKNLITFNIFYIYLYFSHINSISYHYKKYNIKYSIYIIKSYLNNTNNL